MRSSIDRIASFVVDLIHNRRPRRFKASAEEVEALQTAAALRPVQPGADLPARDFIDRLGRQLRSQMGPAPQAASVTRRALLRTAGLAAATGVAGAVIGQVVRFSSGPVEGVLVNDRGTIKAVSAVCTHQGCLLLLDAAAHRLRCPCHPTVFSATGQLLSYGLATPPANLPALQARVRDGQIEVLVV
ncbi:MAG: Rieske (2Fe-2S) protein [Chloroflexi bacterium]|nr:MAG: Rieske (2Fe-2S) protein [Chloroflexota bacterium]